MRSSSSDFRSAFSTASRLGARGHVDEVDDDDPADVAQPQLAHHLLGRLEVVRVIVSSSFAPLPRPVNEPEFTSITVMASA